MVRSIVAAIGALTFAAGAAAQQDCRYGADRSATLSASGARQLVLQARSGSLRVEGVAGSDVRVRGRACTSDESLLDDLDFEVDRRGAAIHVTVREIDHDWSGWSGRDRYARLDLVLEVPAGMAADIRDSSGSMVVRGLGDTRIEDGSGDITAEDIRGLLDIEDGSGSITVLNAQGDVVIDDGSGEIDIDDVRGSVTIDDGSGEIELTRVGRNVHIEDSSGSIDVDEVGGDFVVADDSSGSIRHRGVRGRVDIPERRRRR